MAGATYVIELDYDNDALVRVRERGFAPGESGYFGIERSTSLAYDARGRLSSIDGPREDIADSVQFEYDALDRLTVVRTAAGDTRILGYDYAGRPARLARAGRPDIALEYDAHGKLTSFAELHSRRALTTTYTYDSAGRLVQIVDPQGHRILYRFDGAGRPNRLSRTDSEITIAARYASDDRLERIAAFGREGGVLRTLYYAYDADRRLVEVRDGEGPPLRQLVYADADALPDRTIDPLGHETWLSYDAVGRVLTVRAPDGGSTRTEYDAQGRAYSIIAPNGAGASYLFDDFGRRVAERSADRGETRYVYDAADNLVAKIDARGAVTQLRYDAANRLSAVERDEDIATLRYVNGWLTTIDNGSTGEQYGYDRDGQLVEHIRVVGKHRFRTQFAYDELGRLAVRTLPSGTRLRYRYDESGALESITEERWRGDRLLLRSDANGGRSPSRVRSMNMIAGNGLATRTTFDARSGKWIRRKIEGVAELTYELDEADRITSIRNGTQVRHYSYDPAGRISSARSLAGTVTFGYDVNGNRLISTASSVSEEPSVEHGALNLQGAEGSGVSQYTYAPRSNRLVDVDGTVPRVYDAAGNPLRIASRRYEYDTRGRPVKLFENDRLIAEYRYNFWGERVQKVLYEDGKEKVTTYIYEEQKLVAEADAQGRILREYLYLDHHPAIVFEGGAAYWIHTDHLGTPIAVTNRHRQIIWSADYQPFGAASVDADPDGDGRTFELNLRFPGQYFDREAGTHYNYFRDYDPATGRYLTPDPIGMAGGTNSFLYANGDPLGLMDRLGLYQEDVHYYMMLFLAITAGVNPLDARNIALRTL